MINNLEEKIIEKGFNYLFFAGVGAEFSLGLYHGLTDNPENKQIYPSSNESIFPIDRTSEAVMIGGGLSILPGTMRELDGRIFFGLAVSFFISGGAYILGNISGRIIKYYG